MGGKPHKKKAKKKNTGGCEEVESCGGNGWALGGEKKKKGRSLSGKGGECDLPLVVGDNTKGGRRVGGGVTQLEKKTTTTTRPTPYRQNTTKITPH